MIGKIEDYEGKKYLMADDYALDKVLDKIKRIGDEKHDKITILLDTDDKLPDDIILKKCDMNDMCC